MAYSIPDIIKWAKCSQFLAQTDIANKDIFSWGSPQETLPSLLYIARKSLEKRYDQDSTSASIFSMGQYVLALCGKYLYQAKEMTGSGSTLVGSVLFTALGYTEKKIAFIVGAEGAPMVQGDTVLVIEDANIQPGSVEIFADGALLFLNDTTRFSYSVAYTTPTTTITFNSAIQNDMAMIIKYKKLVP